MVPTFYDKLEDDRSWMQQYGCVKIFEEKDSDERLRPLWKQLMVTLDRGDELVISKFSNALRGSRELAMFLEFCRQKVIRVISIHDKIDTSDELFPDTKPSDIIRMVGSLPDEALALRRSAAHHARLVDKVDVPSVRTGPAKARKMQRETTIINMYSSGHSIDDIWRASGFSSRSSVFRILNKHGITLNRGYHSGPLKKKQDK